MKSRKRSLYFVVCFFVCSSIFYGSKTFTSTTTSKQRQQRATTTFVTTGTLQTTTVTTTTTTTTNNNNTDSFQLYATATATEIATRTVVIPDQQQLLPWWNYTLQNEESLLQDLLQAAQPPSPPSQKPPCGYMKCYYPSLNHKGYGYLIGQYRNLDYVRRGMFTLENLQKAYSISKDIQEKFHLNTTLVSLPIVISYHPSAHFTSTLNTIYNLNKQTALTHKFREAGHDQYTNKHNDNKLKKPRKPQRDKIIVQVVQEFPINTLEVKIKVFDRGNLRNVDKFLNESLNNNNLEQVQQFKLNFQQDVSNLQKMLQLDSEYSKLYNDLQFAITSTGNIWLYDLDCIYGNPKPNAPTGIPQAFNKYIEHVLTKLDQLMKSTS